MRNFIIVIMIFSLESSVSSLDLNVEHFRTLEEANGTEFYALDFIGLVEEHGYRAEWYNVTTDDGYVLSIFRILQNSSNHNNSIKRPVVYLQHALFATADIFIIFGPGRSLVYLLLDAGYDVWLGNLRGNLYSSRHKSILPDDSEFWNFSMDEYALIDLPMMIDYVLENTKQKNLTYIGHSLGSTIILMLLSEKPEYNAKFNAIVHLAPVSFWIDQSAAKYVWRFMAEFFEEVLPSGEFNAGPNTVLPPLIFSYGCMANGLTMFMCRIPFTVWFGNDLEPAQISEMPKLLCYYPAGGSAKVLYHYGQHIRSGKFQHYDYYGRNIQYYGQEDAPSYNVSEITATEIIFGAKNDPVSTEEDINYLISRFPNNAKVIYERIQQEHFHHGSFVASEDVDKVLNINILKVLNKLRNDEGI